MLSSKINFRIIVYTSAEFWGKVNPRTYWKPINKLEENYYRTHDP